jgi:YegS/Rv2252/BmrU family lipid kinase
MSHTQADICIIFNPTAKGERARKWAGEIKKYFPGAEFHVTRKAGHAEELARVAARAGCRRVVAVGGDGTINEVVNGIAGSDATLGLLPLGTVNVFALELGIPSNLKAAAEIIMEGHYKKVDLARANDRYFVQLAGVGFDAETVQATDFEMKKRIGPLSYVLAAARIAAQEPPTLTVKPSDGREEQGCFVLVGNGRYYGGPFEFFPGAKPDDGLLEVCVFKRRSHMDLLHYFQGILCRTHTKFEDVEYFQTRQLVVSANQQVPMEVDGELAGATPVEFSVLNKALKVFVKK